MYVFQCEIKFIGTKRLLNLKAKTKTERKTEMDTDSDRDLWNGPFGPFGPYGPFKDLVALRESGCEADNHQEHSWDKHCQ